ncbi:hypothetical protein FGO68_gene5809 [Halteria grandinella]|uniref:Transmembrane protein n=1 Tax=Halteria grandinella TaxID=5974 RepID=A0A8J8NHV0_HALGN|nr:hypothetical protein FGO68_gene5809 [Halteria grandinella]
MSSEALHHVDLCSQTIWSCLKTHQRITQITGYQALRALYILGGTIFLISISLKGETLIQYKKEKSKQLLRQIVLSSKIEGLSLKLIEGKILLLMSLRIHLQIQFNTLQSGMTSSMTTAHIFQMTQIATIPIFS